MVTWYGFITPYLFVGRVSAASSCDNDSLLILSAVWEPFNDRFDMVHINIQVGMREDNRRKSHLKDNQEAI